MVLGNSASELVAVKAPDTEAPQPVVTKARSRVPATRAKSVLKVDRCHYNDVFLNLDLKTSKEIPVTEMDVALIDLGDPWIVIPKVRQMLKGSGAIFAICPTMKQLEKLTMALVENEFTDIESTEHIIRSI